MLPQSKIFRTIASRSSMAAATLIVILFASTIAAAQLQLRVAAAADLQFAMKDLAAR